MSFSVMINSFDLYRKLLLYRNTKQRKFGEIFLKIQESWKHVMSLTLSHLSRRLWQISEASFADRSTNQFWPKRTMISFVWTNWPSKKAFLPPNGTITLYWVLSVIVDNLKCVHVMIRLHIFQIVSNQERVWS